MQDLYINFKKKGKQKQMDLEYLHESGKMPSRYYNQQNKKTLQQNYKKAKDQQRKKEESIIMQSIRVMLSSTVKTAFNEIFKNFKV